MAQSTGLIAHGRIVGFSDETLPTKAGATWRKIVVTMKVDGCGALDFQLSDRDISGPLSETLRWLQDSSEPWFGAWAEIRFTTESFRNEVQFRAVSVLVEDQTSTKAAK